MVGVDSEHMDTVLTGTAPVYRSWCELVVSFMKQAHLAYRTAFTLGLSPCGKLWPLFFSGNNQLSLRFGSGVIPVALLLARVTWYVRSVVQEDGDGNRECV